MLKFKILVLFLVVFSAVNAQTEDAWVYFKDKPSKSTFLASPLTMLSQRALDRRAKYTIAVDEKDVPVEATYLTQISTTTGITVKAKSKWMNAVHVQGTETAIMNLNNLSSVNYIEFANKSLGISSKSTEKLISKSASDKLKYTTNFNYGQAANQLEMLKGEILHENNFSGNGMYIAIMDAGFPGVNTFSPFQKIRDNNQILGGYDYVHRNANFYTGNSHGTSVLSTIAGYVDNEFVGTAPDANFYLFITEDNDHEVPLEESLWVEAAEEADRLGVDVLSTSLGYSVFFDEAKYNYAYSAMDGKTAFITRGAEIAFSRGMLLVNSAGNEGNDAWHYMNAPADAPSVLSIGAVNATGNIASFSSYGPTFDNRVKPDVCAQGASVYVIDSNGNIATSNGTSFSGPIMAGMVTCLWQAFPNKTNAEITQLVKQSAHLYSNPTTQEGYGIPNFETIYNKLVLEKEAASILELSVYPNPTSNELLFSMPLALLSIDVTIFDTLGKKILQKEIKKNDPILNIQHVSNGLYVVKMKEGNTTKIVKILKK